MFWPPRDTNPYDEPFAPMRDRERLRHLIFLDGRLIDTWSEPVESTIYRAIADEFDREKNLVRYREEPPQPPYERVLGWLDCMVGGRIALLALDDEPLRATPSTDDAAAHALLERVALDLFDAEFLAATHSALATVRRLDADLLAEAPAAEIAAGVCWLLGKANGLVGPRTSVTQTMLKQALALTTSPTRRAPRLKSCLRGMLPEPGWRPAECPDLLGLGNAAYLTSATRRRLIVLRDRALVAEERAEADLRAREASTAGRVDNLTS